MWFCPLHWLFPHTPGLCAGADLSRSRRLVLCSSYMGRAGLGWAVHIEQAGLPAWAGLSHLNKLGCCSAVRGQVMALLLTTNFEYMTAQCYRTALLQRPRRLATTDIVTTAITTDPSLSCKSSQSVHSCTAAGGQEVSTHKGNCDRRFPSSLQAQGPCRKCGALMAGIYLWERTYLPQAEECAHCQKILWSLLIAKERDRKASLYETQLFKFINIKSYAMML